jgi:ribosomal-protein-alanine N-acetyltransferase
MSTPPEFYRLRHMTPRDIPQVMIVNRECFPVPWSAWTIEQDLLTNRHSQWIILERLLTSDQTAVRPWWAWWRGAAKAPLGHIIGFGGFWIMYGEMHITNIGVGRAFRGQGWGEILLAGMLQRAQTLQADYGTLEVRVSNQPAIQLYFKYQYQIVAQQKGYYHDNHEDAHSMKTRPFDASYRQMLTSQLHRLHQGRPWLDDLNS